MRALRQSTSRMVKIRCPLTLTTLYKWHKEGKLVIAEWNRDEVAARIGTQDDWMESIATDVSGGIFLATWKGVPLLTNEGPKCNPTVENPIVVYEGGHRTRWSDAIFKNEAKCFGMTFSDLQALVPEVARSIQTSVIEMTIATSDDGPTLEAFAKRDYDRVNTYTEKLRPGEVIRTHTDVTRTSLEEKIATAMKRTLKPKKRDAHLEDQRALANCAAGLVDKMDKKKGSLTNGAPLTSDQITKAETVIAALGEAETRIDALFADKKVKVRVKNRQLDLALDGTMMWALQEATDDLRSSVVDDIVEFYKMYFEDKVIWGAVLSELKKATKERSRYAVGETPYPTRWIRIQNKIRPPATVELGDDIEVPTTEAL